ncbi:hemerythrin family non-heme iron protein [Campylobacter novaezeelandiae]|uniref:Hemerythrin family non-heme iron protein n=1 Tax=Campylobacter novaezeelandiae TaxID=2267891 RepID=A0A4Q9JVS5_9BACT|nr:bacteriohemerythrin [Campylobacter novaezeelandiae]QWU79439.1 hemerythrin [Campylobacter novaezeelandiae]TBR78175.1 hemerythrin family non-heme iron protein [Campylobacter novaezeelandiae]TBR79235.1 hemerythrin family non-heme iron protein [Campylobacter novaezeelandiae]TBR80260.1 hemerythrin family non-heme iron protein [Campylobacter novaezeelandiae]TBR82005.1 hemerythrin family non-heme iron protein [Campylobacter novaezeelandiae]
MLPKWDKSYSVHNNKIDQQHKKLFELAAKVEYILDKPVYKDKIKILLTEFFNYMRYHFNDEEKYMLTIKYPYFEEHCKIHKEITQSMIELIQNIKTTNDLKEKLYLMVKKWLLEHILYEDMKVEKWRIGALSSEDGTDISFEEVKEEENDELAIYFYTCQCLGKIHDVPFGIHKKIQDSNAKFRCKKCNCIIGFLKQG